MPRGKKTVGEVKEAAKTKKSVLGKVPEIKIPDPQPSIVDEIVWCSKRCNQTAAWGRKDIGLTVSHHKKNKAHKTDYYTLSFSFRDNIEKVFSKDDKICLMYGLVKNRIYFKLANPKVGYKLTKKCNNAYMQATINNDMLGKFQEFCPGEYHLKYDDFQELYYIEKEK